MQTESNLIKQDRVRQKLGGVSDATIHRWCKKGIIPKPVKLGGVNLWPESIVDDVLKSWSGKA